jgi:hypothetical protein
MKFEYGKIISRNGRRYRFVNSHDAKRDGETVKLFHLQTPCATCGSVFEVWASADDLGKMRKLDDRCGTCEYREQRKRGAA